ncbi:MAG: hypothetical protein ACI8RD_007610 [Bacillariaceae sp.]|jgi:hypothetical protein
MIVFCIATRGLDISKVVSVVTSIAVNTINTPMPPIHPTRTSIKENIEKVSLVRDNKLLNTMPSNYCHDHAALTIREKILSMVNFCFCLSKMVPEERKICGGRNKGD